MNTLLNYPGAKWGMAEEIILNPRTEVLWFNFGDVQTSLFDGGDNCG